MINVKLECTKTPKELSYIVCLLIEQVAAPAKAGALAPVDVFIDAHNTGLGPEKTSFFQALSIQTKISRGTIEILVRAVNLPMCLKHCVCLQYIVKLFFTCLCCGSCTSWELAGYMPVSQTQFTVVTFYE